MLFRPLPVLTLIAIPVLCTLAWLGTWQIQRAEWKAGLIRDFESQSKAEPLSLQDALCAKGAPVGRIVSGSDVGASLPSADSSRTVRMFGGDERGGAGWRLLVAAQPPACSSDARGLTIQAGFEPIPGGAPVRTIADRYLVTRWPPRGAMEADNSPQTNDWHWFDAPAIARTLGVSALNDQYYLTPFSGQLPDALVRVPPAQHYGYAVTWYGLAVAFIVIYAAFHARAGRLRFTSEPKNEL